MNKNISLILFIMISIEPYCQNFEVVTLTDTFSLSNINWNDTAYNQVELVKLNNRNGFIEYKTNNRVSIFISAQDFLNRLEFVCFTNNKRIERKVSRINYGDTLVLNDENNKYRFIINEFLQEGKANIYLKNDDKLVPVMFHRLEKYGMYAYRFFYLPDKSPFFAVMEISGIIENGRYFSDPKELEVLREKLKQTGL